MEFWNLSGVRLGSYDVHAHFLQIVNPCRAGFIWWNEYIFSFPVIAWWRHEMETFSVSLALCEENPPVTGGFPSQRLVTRIFDVFFVCLDERLSKQSRRRWFDTPSRSLWRHSNASALIGHWLWISVIAEDVTPVASTSWLLMTWPRKEPGHQRSWYWHSYPGLFRFQNQKG